MSQRKELTKEEFRKMQLVQLDMIAELDRVCRENNINYVMFGGTMLGAIRHKGYIPWDDDADIVMLREDYEKFKTHINELNPNICFFQDHFNDHEYRWGYGKLRRTGTEYVRLGQEHLKCKTGIFIDVFPLDDAPISTIGQMFQDFYSFCLRKILWSEVGKYSAKGFMKLWYNMLSHISVDFPFKKISYYTKKSKNSTPNRVRMLLFPATGKYYIKNPLKERYAMPKKWFLEREEYEFEGHEFYGTKDYDDILKYIYGDYMKLPPESEREQHAPFSKIVFPDDKDIGGIKNAKKNKK